MKEKKWPVELFKKTFASVPAYRSFLQSRDFDDTRIETMDDFKKLPIMDKQYLLDHPRRALFTDGKLAVSASCSSGSSGRPTYWFRSEADDQVAALGYKHVLADVLKIGKEEPVLAIVCFAMGSWVAGTLTVDCLKQIANDGYQLTIFPAGIDQEDGLNALLHLGPEFEHVVIYGYPPLLLDFVHEARHRGIPMGDKVKLIPAGDKNSEQWRDKIAALAGCPREQVVSFYGSADALYMACETPLTHAVKNEALNNPALYAALFGETHVANMPGVYQYNEDRIFLEEINQELILTVHRSLPLIRYNLHDCVKILDAAAMRRILQETLGSREGMDRLFEQWHHPFVIVASRTDVAVNFYGINIYYDHIRNITEAPELTAMLSGNYFAYIENLYDTSAQNLHLQFELNAGVAGHPELESRLQSTAIRVLQETSSEFRKLFGDLQHKAAPLVKTVPFGELKTTGGHTGMYAVKGKKPRMVHHKNNPKP